MAPMTRARRLREASPTVKEEVAPPIIKEEFVPPIVKEEVTPIVDVVPPAVKEEVDVKEEVTVKEEVGSSSSHPAPTTNLDHVDVAYGEWLRDWLLPQHS